MGQTFSTMVCTRNRKLRCDSCGVQSVCGAFRGLSFGSFAGQVVGFIQTWGLPKVIFWILCGSSYRMCTNRHKTATTNMRLLCKVAHSLPGRSVRMAAAQFTRARTHLNRPGAHFSHSAHLRATWDQFRSQNVFKKLQKCSKMEPGG